MRLPVVDFLFMIPSSHIIFLGSAAFPFTVHAHWSKWGLGLRAITYSITYDRRFLQCQEA